MNLSATVEFLRVPILETVAIAAGALFLAIALGAPAAIVIARGGSVGRALRAVAALVRAIPELVLAIVFVVALGFGAVPGTLALGISGAATIAKLYAEILEAVRREPEEALRATGATATASFLVGLVPAAWPGLIGFGAYTFESIMRAAVIVGVVGAGGLGSAMITSLNLLDYRAFAWYVAALVALVVAVDAVSGILRARAPAWVALAAFASVSALGIAALATATHDPWHAFATAPPRVVAYLARAIPPAFTPAVIASALWGVAETLGVALAGTIVGAIAAVPLALLIARVVASGWVRGTGYRPWSIVPATLGRIALVIARSVPPIAVALVALAFVGLGPKAGAVALALHTAGVLGKLFAESLELGDTLPAEALVASGSTGLAAVAVGIAPATLPAMSAHLLYRWEWNVRASTTLGIVGAGGLGQQIFNAQQLLHDRELLAYVLVAMALVLASDALAERAARRFALRTMER
ncbi:MAG: phosphonate ABC transporter, permease protein PhnE [Vulcanimicrobiaceae bacterium]